METKFWKSIVTALAVIIGGIVLCLIDLFLANTYSKIWISVGCSLIASGLVILLTTLLVDRKKENPLDEWKIDKIFSTRMEKNIESDPKLELVKNYVDGIAFGLSKFRSQQNKRVEACLKRGLNFRFITMNPDSPFLSQRDKEEDKAEGTTKDSIEKLVKWADALNRQKYSGRIIIKAYNCMTLDFYWRLDDELFIGPYWLGEDSSTTITYKFKEGGKGFSRYSEYFERLWEYSDFSILTELKTFLLDESKESNRHTIYDRQHILLLFQNA